MSTFGRGGAPLSISHTVIATADAAGELNAVAVYFELTVGTKTLLSTHPSVVEESNHWLSPVRVLADPLKIREGDRFQITYWYRMLDAMSGCEVQSCASTARRVECGRLTRIAANGFGDAQNAYMHGMASFRGRVYAGTSRHSLALLKLFPPSDPPAMDPWPVRTPATVDEINMYGQMWSCDEADGVFQKVYQSPAITAGEAGAARSRLPRDDGLPGPLRRRACALRHLDLDGIRGTAAHVLRSADGSAFEPV